VLRGADRAASIAGMRADADAALDDLSAHFQAMRSRSA
jgi:hypothetical protein